MRRAIAIAITGLALFAAACESDNYPRVEHEGMEFVYTEPCERDDGLRGYRIPDEAIAFAVEQSLEDGEDGGVALLGAAFAKAFCVPFDEDGNIIELDGNGNDASPFGLTSSSLDDEPQETFEVEIRSAQITDRYESDFCFGQETCYETADDGKIFVLVDLLARNTGSEAESFSQTRVDLLDRDNILLGSPPLVVGLIGAFQGGTLGTGQAAAGLLRWEVPEGSCPCMVRVNVGDLFSPNYIQLNLNATEPPMTFSPPPAPQQASLDVMVRHAEITDRYESDLCFGQETCYEEADAGESFLLVDLLVRNTGSEAENFIEQLQVDLENREGILLGSPDVALGLKGGFQGGVLGMGQAAAGFLLWQVPEGSCPCVMRVDVGTLLSPNYIQFNLNTN